MKENIINFFIAIIIVIATGVGINKLSDYMNSADSYKRIDWEDETQICVREKQSGNMEIKEYCIKK
jgi:hypothetical protein